ncbi:hypothetical protein RHMOL_RhmolUnG0005300 [Rhododendron molle]|nr:hypothetical protein RHMOL_RhmolUnG0005300 [Rhododendron molle]
MEPQFVAKFTSSQWQLRSIRFCVKEITDCSMVKLFLLLIWVLTSLQMLEHVSARRGLSRTDEVRLLIDVWGLCCRIFRS